MSTREPPVGFLLGLGPRPTPIYKGDVLTLGREPQNSIFLEDALASRRHASVECDGQGQLSVKDLGSRNGTWLHESRLPANQAAPLNSGDNFRVGGKIFTYLANAPTVEPRKVSAQAASQLANRETLSVDYFFKDGKVVKEKEGEGDGVVPDTGVHDTVVAPKPKQPLPDTAFSGNLKDQSLAQILQFLHTNGTTGILTVTGKHQHGELAFEKGQLIFAEIGAFEGSFAVYSMARETEGNFKFEKTKAAPPRPANIHEPTLQVILESCRRMDEALPGTTGDSSKNE